MPDSRSATRRVPVLITADVDLSGHHAAADKELIFDRLIGAFDSYGVHATFFWVAREAEQLGGIVRRIAEAGHEVACHGLTHGDEEEYDSLPVATQRRYIETARRVLEDLSKTEVTSFRAPRVKVSGSTYDVLASQGFVADSSVCSQRLDLISSNLLHMGWLRAPRLPYRPDHQDAFRRGSVDLMVVPISALVLPFISSSLYVLGLPVMKLLFKALYRESRFTGKPVVYLFHPYEFIPEIEGRKDYAQNIRVHGLRFRRHLYRGTPEEKLQRTIRLLDYISRQPGIQFMTMRQFAREYPIAASPDDGSDAG